MLGQDRATVHVAAVLGEEGTIFTVKLHSNSRGDKSLKEIG